MFPVHHSVFYCRRWILKLCSDLYLGGQSCLFSSHLATIKRSVSDGLHLCYICRMCNSVCLSVCLTVRLSFHPSVRPPSSIRSFVHPFARLFNHPSKHLLVQPSIHQPIYPTTNPTIHPSVCVPYVFLSVCPYTYQPTHLFPVLARTIIVFRYLPSFLGCPLRYYYCC